MNIDAIKQAAAAEGYELAYSEESYGSTSFGLIIFAKMSERKLCEDDHLYAEASAIRRKLQTTSVKLDLDGPALRRRYRDEVVGVYRAAGVEAVYVEELPNGYCSEPCCINRPWFRVTSRIGHVVIGWRKSVMSIDWKDSQVKASGEELFPAEQTTRLETGIHAWGVERAAAYVRRLHEAAPAESE